MLLLKMHQKKQFQIKVKLRKSTNPLITELESINNYAKIEGFSGSEEVQRSLNLLHEWREVMYYSKTQSWHLSNKVCIDPKWLSELFKTVHSFKCIEKKGVYHAILTKLELEDRWKAVQFPDSIFPYLFELLENQFQIIVSLPEKKGSSIQYIIPS